MVRIHKNEQNFCVPELVVRVYLSPTLFLHSHSTFSPPVINLLFTLQL